MVRTDVVWSDVHAGTHQYDFSRYDRLIPQLHEHGLKLLLVLHYNKFRLDDQGREIWNTPPDSFEEFARYVEATVRRYKKYAQAWEIWNEPNHPVYWNAPLDDMRPYCRLLSLSYNAAKNIDPACTVINGGITGDVANDVAHFYESGGGDVTDKLNIHTFFHPRSEDSLHLLDRVVVDVRSTMIRFGDEAKKIWITEMGCPGLKNPSTVKPWWVGANTSESEQEEWIGQIYAWAQKYPEIEKLFWAFYRDTGSVFRDGVDYFGLVRNDFSPKPAFQRLKRLIQSEGSKT
jgi:hypothetical protein